MFCCARRKSRDPLILAPPNSSFGSAPTGKNSRVSWLLKKTTVATTVGSNNWEEPSVAIRKAIKKD